jgi:hypothetical protein
MAWVQGRLVASNGRSLNATQRLIDSMAKIDNFIGKYKEQNIEENLI